VILRVRATDSRLLIEVEDECGGDSREPRRTVPAVRSAPWTRPDGTGAGAVDWAQGIRAHLDDIPGHGCVFLIDLPLASECVPNRTVDWDWRHSAAR
jgi:hypothetical protein